MLLKHYLGLGFIEYLVFLYEMLCCHWVFFTDFWLLLSHSHFPLLVLNLQNDQKDYFVCGVKLPNSEDFQGSWIFLT